MPVPDLLVDRFPCLPAHGRVEADEVAVLALDQAAPEGVAGEVEAGVLIAASALRVLAVHDLRLAGVQLQAQGPEPVGDGGQKIPGLLLAATVDDDVVRTALERGTHGRIGKFLAICAKVLLRRT
jgi:hypothetical protein